MSEARIDGYARAMYEIAQAEGAVNEVEKELFTLARTIESNEQLRNTLTDESIPIDRRQSMVEQLIGAKASSITTHLVSFLLASGRGRELPAIAERLSKRASLESNREVAEVRSAVALTPEQQQRLSDALTQATGKQVNLKIVIDPLVLGGLVATVGDTVIDGTVRTRLDQLKSRL